MGEDVKTDVEMWIEKDGEDFLKTIGIKEGQTVSFKNDQRNFR